MRKVIVGVFASVAIAGGVASASAVTSAQQSGPEPLAGSTTDDRLFTRGEVVVRYARSTDAAERADARAAVGAESATSLEVSRAQLIELPAGTGVRSAVAELAADPAVEFAEPNYVYHTDAAPDDTFFNQLWGLDNTGQTISTPNAVGAPGSFPGTADADIDAPDGWDVAPVEGGDASDVVVAVADTGIDYNHPDLASNMWHNPGEIPANGIDDDANGFVDDIYGADFKADWTSSCSNTTPPTCTDADPIDNSDSNHGTHVAGTIGARGNDGYGVTGVSQRVQLMAVKVFDDRDFSSNVSVGNAFAYAGQEGADVVNASLGGGCPSALQASAIQANPDVLFVFSAGNGGPNGLGDNNDINDDPAAEFAPTGAGQCGDANAPGNTNEHPGQYPCNFNAGPEAAGYPLPYDFPNVMCVASSTNTDVRSGFSNYGPTSVQIAAPGSQVLSTQPAYRTMLSEGAENPGFDGRLVDGTGTPITTATATGWRQVSPGLAGSGFSLSESPFPGNYAASSNFLARPATQVDLSNADGCHLEWTFDLAFTDFNDFVGLMPRVGTTPINIGQAWTGSGVFRRTPGVPEVNGEPSAGFEVQFFSDSNANLGEGARVDDLGLLCLGGTYTPEEVGPGLIGTHKFFNGTSMATPHVTGAAALIRAKAPALTPAQVIQRIMDGGDPNAAFATAGATPVQSGKRLNLNGALNAGSPAIPAAPTISGPSGTTSETSPTFALSTDLAGSRFQCVLDGTTFGDCTTADSFTPASPLADGGHELRVRAIGGEGGVSPTSTQAFTVDTTPPPLPAGPDTRKPVVTITKGPKAKTKRKKASFEFSADEVVTFTCQLDRKPAAPCTSPTEVKAKKGKHTFTVTATDAAGNTGQAVHDWKVKKKPKKHHH